MIESFADKRTAAIFDGQHVKGLPGELQGSMRRKLKMIDATGVLDTLRVPPGNALESLKGDRKGQYSIRVNQQWRICFRWKTGNAHEVEIVDYH
jgi:toxin HigB-1